MDNNIKEICRIKNMTITQVIKISGLSRSQVYAIANGEFVPTVKTARKIAKALNMKLEEVFPEELEDK